MKIYESLNGYWYAKEWFYLDEVKYECKYKFETIEHRLGMYLPSTYEKEWEGNNPFMKSECLRLWLESKKAFIEVEVFSEKVNIVKVLTDDYHLSHELQKDLIDLDILYKDVIKAFEEFREDYEEDE